ncbi:MAG TPA: HAMP domain-containing sensor histidine kinase [Nitrososphaeraceae archaeon]
MQKLELVNNRLITNRKISIATAAVIIILVVLDLLTTRQILYFNNTLEIFLFILTVGIGYGIGSWILLGFTKNTTKDLTEKSRLIRVMHVAVTLIQYSLLGILLYILYNNLTYCYGYFSLCDGTGFLTTSLYAIASITATIIMGILSFKFFSWYRLNNRNFIVLFYGLAAAALAISISGDAFDKLLLAQIVQEKSPSGAIPQSSFIYKTFEKYHGEIEYKVVNPHITTLYVVPTPKLDLYNQIIYWTSDAPYILTWAGTALLLGYYYKRTGKLDLKFWIIISVPLILYLVGSGLIFSLPADIPYRFYFRLVFRAGTIGSSVLFGLAFYIISRYLTTTKVKDYLTISAIGIIMIGIANEISALQQTYGVAAHSLVLLASYLFTIGLYSSAISLSQDSSLRQSIRKSAIEVSKLVEVLGAPKIEQEIERRVLNVVSEQRQVLREQSGVDSSLTEHDVKQYLGNVLKEIKILRDVEEILKKGKEILQASYQFIVCSRFAGIRLFHNNYFDVYQKVMERYRKGEHKGVKLVTTIDKDNTDLVKKFLGIGVQIRHIRNMPPIDFAVSDKEMIATTEKMEPEELIRSLLVTNKQPYISHFVFIFDELWKNGIDAKDRIAAIEQGLEPEFVEVITDNEKASQILVDLAKSVKKEALFLLPIDRAMSRVDRLGIIDYLIHASRNGAEVKIICPLSSENADIVKRISSNARDIKILNGNNSPYGMFIVDGEKFFRAELREPIARELSEAIGFPIYSNSKRSVESFKSVFELLWNERTLNEELKRADKMQKEFINIAAHELRSPIQPILSITEVLRNKIKDTQQLELLDITIRNARRLQRLSEDILDVTRIESQSLYLKKERIDVNEMIVSIVADFSDQIKNKNKDKNLKLAISTKEKEDIIVLADRSRLYQVVSNLLNNAVKFTEEGAITVSMENKEESGGGHIVVSIKDTGAGIDSEVLPRLFEKFTSKSYHGSGLGLFISKSIIEAHGGRMWAGNNIDGKGATFSFSLPITNSSVCSMLP